MGRYTSTKKNWRDEDIPTYVVLSKFTQKGIENIKDSLKRLEDLRKLVKSVGGEMKYVYYTMGRYDAVGVTEFPNDEACMQAAMAIGSSGNIRTETLKAFNAKEAAKIIEKL